MMKVGFLQFMPQFGQCDQNTNTILAQLSQAEDASLIVLPELAFTGYYFADRAELAALAEDPKKSDAINSLIELCQKKNLILVSGFAEKTDEKIYNSALLIGKQGIITQYRKLHLFNEEKNFFDKGDIPLSTTSVAGVKIGMMVCFDWVFPEVARVLALQGSQIICHPANLVLTYCQKAMQTRSLENGVFSITANRTGTDTRPHGALTFTGQSQIVGPTGELLKSADDAITTIQMVEIDPQRTHEKSITAHNHLMHDRRPEYYTPITQQN